MKQKVLLTHNNNQKHGTMKTYFKNNNDMNKHAVTKKKVFPVDLRQTNYMKSEPKNQRAPMKQ